MSDRPITGGKSRESVGLSGVPETMLWTLHNRAGEARRADAKLIDPKAIEIADAIDYDYVRSFGPPDFSHALRAILFDDVLRPWLAAHPGGQVVALGEGLETQFHRLDDGRVRWLSVDLPESIEVRRRFLPDTGRHRNLPCSALDFRWMDEVDPSAPVFITAAGLLMYLQEDDVRRLLATIAERFPTCRMVFDVIPEVFSARTRQGYWKTPHYQVPPMPWGLNRSRLQTLRTWHPNIAEVRELPWTAGRGFVFGVLFPMLRALPVTREWSMAFVELTCRPA